MTRSQSPRKQGARGPVVAMLTAAACLGTAQAAEPEKVIFAAENALYGAGHDIGRADGWIDEQLRAAIRAYQAQNGLQTNGNLDTATLKALGVTNTSNATITANSVGSRKASVAQLGLSLPEPAPNTLTIARAEPKPAPEPTPAPIQKSSEQGESTTSLDTEPVKHQIVTEETSKRTEVKPQEKVAEAAPKTPEPVASEPPAPTSAPGPEPAVAEETTPEATKEPDPVLAQLPAEPTSAGPAEPKAADTKKAQPIEGETTASTNSAVADNSHSTGGGFFSVLFDFFFGWLV